MFGSPPANQPLPAIPDAPAPPPLLGTPQGAKPGKKSQAPTFLGADATPQGNVGGKTLLGQ